MPHNRYPPPGDRRVRYGFAKEAIGFSAAEAVSMGTSLGVVAVADSIAPKAIDHATKIIAKKFILPHLESIERKVGRVCKVDSCQADEEKSRQQRAEKLARAVVIFTPAWLISMGAKVVTRRLMNKHFEIKDAEYKPGNSLLDKTAYKMMNPYEWKVFLADEVVHYGSLIYFNTKGAEYTNDLVTSTSKMLEKQTGMSKKKADELSSMAVIWELPNLLGLVSGLGVVFGKHRLGRADRRGPHGHGL